MHQSIKRSAQHYLNKAGFFRLFGLVFTKNKLRILTYHRFGDHYITSDTFERQLKYMKKYYNVIDIDTLVDLLLSNRSLPPYSVLITIDDGYCDFYDVAFPLLKKFRIPALVFLATDFLREQKWLWHDLLNYSISTTSRHSLSLNGKVFDLSTERARLRSREALATIGKRLSPTSRDDLIEQIIKELNISIPPHPTSDYAPLTTEQVIEMSTDLVSYGAHTCTHSILTTLQPEAALLEIRQSKLSLKEILQREIIAFAYPNGTRQDFNETIKNFVKDCEYKCAMSMIYGMNHLRTDNFELRRIPVGANSFDQFTKDLSGFPLLTRLLLSANS